MIALADRAESAPSLPGGASAGQPEPQVRHAASRLSWWCRVGVVALSWRRGTRCGTIGGVDTEDTRC